MYLQRIEEVASSAFLSPEEEGDLVGKVYGKARAHRTARLERERRRRKLAVDQELAKEVAEVEHAAQVDWANIQVLLQGSSIGAVLGIVTKWQYKWDSYLYWLGGIFFDFSVCYM